MPLRSGYIAGKSTGGPQCEAFERELEDYYGVRYARVFNSATSALHAALLSIGVRRGDGVVVPAYSMSASATSILMAGGIPIFCDISERDYCIDMSSLRRKYSIKAGVFVHLFGYHGNVPPARFPWVVDCAQAPSWCLGKKDTRNIAVYSLNQHKIIQTGEGGYALTNNKLHAERLHLIRNHGETVSEHFYGHNYRMTEMQAEIGRQELQELDSRLLHRRTACWAIWPESENMDWYLAPTQGKNSGLCFTEHNGYVTPIYKLPYFKAHRLTCGAPCPVTERVEARMVWYDPREIVEKEQCVQASSFRPSTTMICSPSVSTH